MASFAEGVSETDKNAVGVDFQTPIVKSEAVFFTERDECLSLINTLVKSSMEASVEDTSTEEDEEGRLHGRYSCRALPVAVSWAGWAAGCNSEALGKAGSGSSAARC